jgi:L,D-transpeptidase catalytic domain
MIDRQQLAAALGRLDPRDREVLDYSLRRHVPDNDLAAIFDCGPSDVARMRAGAVERLADDLGVQRGADLGQVLTALLDAATWDGLERARPLEDARRAAARPDARPPSSDAAPAVERQPTPVEAVQSDTAPAEGPVLGMLGGASGRGRGDDPKLRPASGSRRLSIAAALLIALLIAVGMGSVLVLGDDASSSTLGDDENATRPFQPHEEAIGEPFPSDPESAYRYPVAVIDKAITLLDAPRGKPKVRVAAKTEWDSPRVMSIVDREGEWLAVLVPELQNGEIGWMQERDVDRLDTVGWALRANLTKRELKVERNGEVVRTIRVGIGREDHPTPTGRFAVTDKLRVNDSASPYGCCVVALTGHQTRLPVGWPGGDRLAVHATSDTSGIGQAVSLGCLRVEADDAKWLLEALPLGTPVFIESGEPKPRAVSQKKHARR